MTMTNKKAIEYNKNLREYMRITDKDSEYKFLKENYEALEMGIKALDQTMWIPVSEKMPEEDGYYVVSGGGKVWVCEMLNLTNTVKGWCNSIQKPSVEAWMSLPQPYKEGDKDDD